MYDGENKQVKASNGGGVLGEYWYDGDGKPVKKRVPSTDETAIFVYDAAGKLIGEYSAVVADVEDAKVAYLTADHLGSPRINTDRDGKVTARHDYHPYGEEIITAQRTSHAEYTPDSVRTQFTGYERDGESNLDFAQARMYGYSLGRFTSPDSPLLDQIPDTPQTWNLYIRAVNNPMKYIDATGLWHTDKDGNVLGDYDGECNAEMGACWDEASGTWDFGGDKTPVQSTGSPDVYVDDSMWEIGDKSMWDFNFGANRNSPFSLSSILPCKTPNWKGLMKRDRKIS